MKTDLAGFDPAGLVRLAARIEAPIAANQLAGAVMLIRRRGQTAHLRAYGSQVRERAQPMAIDAIFRAASMTKAVTAVAVMMLHEAGEFQLTDSVADFLPAFAHPVVAEASSDRRGFRTVPARGPIRIIDLLTHTAGLTYGEGVATELYQQARLCDWYLVNRDETIGAAVDRLATLPLHAHPGEAWQYGLSYDVLGRLVEVVSGQTLERFFADKIFAPLRMSDTCFFLPAEKASRLANLYALQKGVLSLAETAARSDYLHGPRKLFSGGAGLLTTVPDYGRFLEMLLNEGQLDGARLLAPRSVELMRTNHTGDLCQINSHAFGFGFWVNNDPRFDGEFGRAGAYGWGGAFYPKYLVDPREGLVVLFMAQLMPAEDLDLHQKVKAWVYEALLK